MLQRGRKRELAVVTTMPDRLPEPPQCLSDDQAHEWRAIVTRMPSDWFTPETWPLLEQLCRHITMCRQYGEQLAQFDGRLIEDLDDLKFRRGLATLHDLEGRAVSSLSTKLRLTPNSRYSEKKANTKINRAGNKIADVRPWERDCG